VLEKDGRPDPRTGFYHKFKEEIAEHDDYLQKKQDEYLNTTLIFVSFIPSPKANVADASWSPVCFRP